MAKSLLILMLAATQLLAGSGGSLYLCISNDGSYCCFDSGPESCTCCIGHDEEHAACVASERDGCACQCHDRDGKQQAEPSVAIADDGCGCIHIPLIVSAEQPTTATRPAATLSAERIALSIASLASIPCSHTSSVSSPPPFWSGPPAVPEYALTIVSTVVIRC
ncbi:MAG: hypothetical protein KatS3mg114_0933 [Planctomycetaceae bacterium]|nr:MAG: hypothetical protein KatS3mg114_0933 [Planctomycetaceae bacterium]